jgi:thiol-disulfide isomerase/thioredoxin
MKRHAFLYLLLLLPFVAPAQTTRLNIKVSNAKAQVLKLQLPVDGTWFSSAADEFVLNGDSSISVEVPVRTATCVRVNGWYVILEPGQTNISVDYAAKDIIPNVDRNMEGVAQFAKRNTEFYQTIARAYYEKDSTAAGLLKLIERDRLAELKPYQDLLTAKKISLNFFMEIDHFLKVQANIMEAAIPMLVFSETKKLNADLDHMWKTAYEKISWEDLKNTFHPDFFYHADYYAFTYLQYYQALKQGRKLEVKDESTYLKLKYAGFGTSFKGKMREYLMASFLVNEMMQKKFQPELLELFAAFKKEYPASNYSRYIAPQARDIEAFLGNKSAEMNTKQKVIADYQKIDSFEQLLAHFKDKDVFIDVWATWCSPCKEEFKHSKELAEFLNKSDVEMLFISTDKDEVDELWKTMIKYYNLDGWHIRVNKNLLQDMLNKFWDGKGYAIPRYILVSKGRVVNANMLRPGDKTKLYTQLKALLKK